MRLSTKSSRTVVLIIGLVVALPLGAAAQLDPYEADPLDLIAFHDQVQMYAGATDVIEVFVCDVPDGNVSVDLDNAVDEINSQLQPYFTWLSGAQYLPVFVAGSVVTASQPSGWPDSPVLQTECEILAEGAASGNASGGMVIVDAEYSGGYATPGFSCEVVSECTSTFPDNGRVMVVGATTIVPSSQLPDARMSTVAHELGHMLHFPHSYGGLTTFLNGVVYEYDNPMDVMSGGSLTVLDVGTLAINRYAAGWLDTGVSFHRGGIETYELATIGSAGTQMLVLPTDIGGVFTVIDARLASSFDSGIAVEGIEVYQIDQRSEACAASSDGNCWGPDRRTTPVPAADDPESLAHVFSLGESFSVGTVDVEVTAVTPGGWEISVSGSAVSERFLDDNGSIHEIDISVLADLHVTNGCNPPLNSFFCPTNNVTRAEMAVFLARALGDDTAPTTGVGVFTDVPAGQWYSDPIARMFELGITTGYADGTYRPFDAVSRGEMAVLLDRAFESIALVSEEVVFTDVPLDAFYAGATQALFDSGVTTGCSVDPLSFCPAASVSREQMASFLVRVLTG